MKKIKIAAVLLFVPVAAMCACTGASSLSFTANWYKNTSITAVSDTYERLEYKVTFNASSASLPLSVEYDEGTYVTELKNELITLADGTTAEGYVYTTNLTISGRYSMNGETSETFNDSLSSVVKFLSVNKNLCPVKSETVVHTTSPVNTSAASLENAIHAYNYTFAVAYDVDLTTASTTYTEIDSKSGTAYSPITKDYDISGNGTYLDNEQIAFALRGLSLSSSGSFRSLNTVMKSAQSVSYSAEAVTETVDFEADGEQVSADISAYSVTVSFPAGQSKIAVYAATTDRSSNAYRNVMLRLESPVIGSLGTLVYTLTKAEFSAKS